MMPSELQDELERLIARQPYEGTPQTAQLRTLDQKLSSPVGALELAMQSAMTAGGTRKTEGDIPNLPLTPRQVDAITRRQERKASLLAFKRGMYPLIKLYTEEMEANPDLADRNSMAASFLLALAYTDEWRYALKCLAHLQAIFGHASLNLNVTKKTSSTPLDERVKAITVRAIEVASKRHSAIAEMANAGADREQDPAVSGADKGAGDGGG